MLVGLGLSGASFTIVIAWWLSIVLGVAAAIVHLPISERPRVAVSAA